MEETSVQSGPSADARCPRCREGETHDPQWVTCANCFAWHHRECWQGYGSCGTCGGKAIRPKRADNQGSLERRILILVLALAMIGGAALTWAGARRIEGMRVSREHVDQGWKAFREGRILDARAFATQARELQPPAEVDRQLRDLEKALARAEKRLRKKKPIEQMTPAEVLELLATLDVSDE